MIPKLKRTVFPRVHTVVSISILAMIVLIVVKSGIWLQRVVKATGLSPGTLVRLVFNTGAPLVNSADRTNILVLGIGGGTHAGADLTDTMIVLSLRQKNYSMALISLARDIWSDSLKDKINTSYHYGQEKKKGGGIILAKAVVEDVIGLPVHYAIVVDFSGFQQVIDLVGGITVDVPDAFTDIEFPIEGREEDECDGDPAHRCRYETIHFDKGGQNMTGDQALKYVRSRHAQGSEGSDFARSRRQQDVLIALKQKLTSVWMWLNLQRSVKLVQAFDAATDTDLNFGQVLTVGKLLARTKSERIDKISIEDLLETPPLWLYGRYVLVPKESFEEIHEFIRETLNKSN